MSIPFPKQGTFIVVVMLSNIVCMIEDSPNFKFRFNYYLFKLYEGYSTNRSCS